MPEVSVSPSSTLPASLSSDACEPYQWRVRHPFSLDQDLEPLAHALGMDERLELQACANTFRLALPLIVKVCEFIALPERQQECGLRREPGSFKTRSLAPSFERGEIDVRGQVLLTGRNIVIFRRAMILIGEKRAAHMVVVEEFRGAMTVVDRENISALKAAPDFGDPIAGLESSFS